MTGECPPAFPISTVAIVPERLRAEQGGFRLSIIEPMDEAVHLDHLKLDVVDRPPGVSTTTDERFTPTGLDPPARFSPGARSSGLPGRLTTTINASSRRALRVESSSARFGREGQGRFA